MERTVVIMLNPDIRIIDSGRRKIHAKASEEYVQVQFLYENGIWEGWVPVEYRRTGVSINNDEELCEYLNAIYEQLNPANLSAWQKEQESFWAEKERADVTKGFYDCLVKGGWRCVSCDLPPNRNWARRVQDLKEFGYTLATDTKRYCPRCDSNNTHILLLHIKRGGIEDNGYETWSPALRKRIIRILEGIDVYENRLNPHSLPDHKFSEIRWGKSTKAENPDDMTDDEIREKFQLLSNQRNQQKREACRTCYQTGRRGTIYGIPFFYKGTDVWDEDVPKVGKDAVSGCVGCAWYDIEEWRRQVIKKLKVS
jgi:hypothetical protein